MDVGSIDKINAYLSSAFGLESQCFWADDLARRIDSCSSIKWSFPQIIRGTDLLERLLEGGDNDHGRRRRHAIITTVSTQYRSDLEVRFKEIDLKYPLIDLFVDMPSQPISSEDDNQRGHGHNSQNSILAAGYLLNLHDNDPKSMSIILQGAPGQGKSTVTQYVCQMHRIRFLNKEEDIRSVPENLLPRVLRLPVRADLRDFAAWIEGRVAFGPGAAELRGSNENSSLEAFLAALVHHASGGINFDVHDLHATLRSSFLLLALDGFDEVANLATRDTMIEAIELGVARLRDTCQNVQIIVTSRPSAFNHTSKFEEARWQYVNLLNLTQNIIEDYSLKWAKVRNLSEQDRSETIEILRDKLNEQHIAELARNPMQLSILLSLILQQGASLPNKRTELYSEYNKLFFDRESQKSPLVRRYRALLISIHEYIAFVLHADAEIKGDGDSNRKVAPGTITLPDLKQKVRDYLIDVGHPDDLLDGLYTGITERVVALVSRKQGTYEFPVQPLREYFAAQYLYKTASVRPGVVEGSRPQRFRALAQRS